MGEQKSSDRDWKREAAAWRARAMQLQATIDRLRSLAVAGESAGFLAHELNNLYTPVVGYCQAAASPDASELVRQKAIEKSLAAAERTTELAEAILQLAGTVGGESAVSGSCDLREAVEAGLLVLGTERWGRDGIEVRIDVPRGTVVGVRSGVVQQVVMNLALNARRAMEGRRGSVVVRALAMGGVVRMTVEDGGVGMNRQVMATVFGITLSDDSSRGHGQARGTATGERDRFVIDVQDLARSGSINGQARWGVKVKKGHESRDASGGAGGGANAQRSAAVGGAAQQKIKKLSAGKVAPSMSPIKVWDAREVAAELRSAAGELPASRASHGAHRAPGLRSEPIDRPGSRAQHGLGDEAVSGVDRSVSRGASDDAAAPQGTRERGGSGLGLALCLELVSRAGGRMWAESRVGEGTVVTVEWPAAEGGRGRRAA